MNIDNLELKNDLFLDLKQELTIEALKFKYDKIDFSIIHKLQGNPIALREAFENQLKEEIKTK